MYYNVEMNDEIWKVLDDETKREVGMEKEEISFLCGLIKEKKPRKLVEVGVASGGTSCAIIECLERNDVDVEMYSIDAAEGSCYNGSEACGHLIGKYKQENELKRVKHTLLTGCILPEVIDEIASLKEVDFLILDTIHILPGELFDFLVGLPYLKDGAIVVLHDVGMNISGFRCYEDAFSIEIATKVLFDVVSGKKYQIENWEYKPYGIPNIAAFEITNDTRTNVMDVISALSLTWETDWVFSWDYTDKYVKNICKNYNEECKRMLLQLIEFHRRVEAKNYVEKYMNLGFRDDSSAIKTRFRRINNWWSKQEKIVIYGNGFLAEKYIEYAKMYQLRIDAICVTDGKEKGKERGDVPIYYLSELPYKAEECTIIIATIHDDMYFDISQKLDKLGYLYL